MDKLTLFLLGVLAFIFALGVVLSTLIFDFAFTLGVVTLELVVLWALFYKREKHISHSKAANAGIILSAGSVIVALLWFLAGSLLYWWESSYQISTLARTILVDGPTFALSIAGLALYMRGRKAFWRVRRELSERMLLAIIGTVLIIMGGWFGWATIYFRSYLFFIMSLLWFIPGIRLLIDNLTANR